MREQEIWKVQNDVMWPTGAGYEVISEADVEKQEGEYRDYFEQLSPRLGLTSSLVLMQPF